ncbi:hypothetical protein A3L09_10480 [Thermococcus profundus]|uniref:Uncharacterized protein n=1 Tax=Thermococcus profundus TaxID=49899 RepID=A0A2Z2MDK8_THEPR|nr:hypothetical protein [Thermococcus profundus]ASJ03653.1 hypothetical protein A3L09_10480 [Thermococcus profundus]
MGKRPELIPFTLGLLIMAYLLTWIPRDKVIYVLPYGVLSLAALRRRGFSYGAASLFGGSFVEWILTGSYLALVGMAAAFLAMPVRVEKQPVKLWERALNAVAAGAVAYASILSPRLDFKVVGLLVALGILSSNRGISGGGLLVASAVFMATGEGPETSSWAALALMLYSLHHLRKLLR